jgi:hypothetical protein
MSVELSDLKLKFSDVSVSDHSWGSCGRINEPTAACTVTNEDGKSWHAAAKPKAEIDMIEAMREARERLGDDALVERILAAANGMADYARAEENSNHERF